MELLVVDGVSVAEVRTCWFPKLEKKWYFINCTFTVERGS